MPDSASLPIDDVLGEISDHLSDNNRLVLAAPPGAGKTTRVPLHLLESGWLGEGRIILIEPRRIAARRAAERMAGTLGEKVGETVGLRSRLDTRVSARTRIEVVTDGVFSNQIIRDPDLPGVSAVLFDEFHERGLEADLGLTLALESQEALRDDLRLVIMSATLNTDEICGFLKCGLVESSGRAHPVTTHYIGRTQDRLEDQMARAIRRALTENDGSVLAFLPGAAEIRRTAERLTDLPSGVMVCPLYGALSPQEQDAAISAAPKGQRKVVLSTDIAESSLTIEGVRIVVDAGLARVPYFKPGMASSRLETRRASLANVDQRRGRAGRTEPGVCYRLWHEEENRGLPRAPEPEILATDLSALVLRLAMWGESDPTRLAWLTPPSRGQVEGAKTELRRIGYLDRDDKLTEEGRTGAGLPLSPRLARLVTSGKTPADKALGAELAALLSEPALIRRQDDLQSALGTFRSDKSVRAQTLKKQANKWSGGNKAGDIHRTGEHMARAWPDRIANVRGNDPYRYQGTDGQGYRLPEGSSHLGQSWLIIGDTGGSSRSDQIIRLATVISEALARELVPPERKTFAEFDPARMSIRARERQMIGEIILNERPLQKPGLVETAQAIRSYIATNGLSELDRDATLKAALARYAFAQKARYSADWPEANHETLASTVETWLMPLVETQGLNAITPARFGKAFLDTLDWSIASVLDQLAPVHWELPSGRSVAIDYVSDQAPMISARVQDFYGLTRHPAIADGQVPLTISLLSPAQRPVAVTKDLPGFWIGGYTDMRKDMKGRYPKHDWPEDPANASPRKPGDRRKPS